MEVALNITGGSYPSKAVQLSAQVTRNFYPELQDDPFTKDQYVLQPWPGLTLFGTVSGGGTDRGMLEHQGVLYKVSGIKLYSVSNLGTHTELGTITGSAQCILRGMGEGVIIANGSGKVYYWNGSTLTEGTDADFETPNSVAVLNNQAIYDGDGGRFASSKVGEPLNIDGLDYATAESSADALIRVYTFDDKLMMFGAKTIEQWFNSGIGRPPFDRIEGGNLTIGLASRMSVSSNDNSLYFLGDDRLVYRNNAPVSSIALAHVFEGYTTVSDAIGFCFTFENQNFYHLSFPTEDKTWCYSEKLNQWFELSRSASTGRDRANSYAYAYGKHLIADYSGPNIYYWDVNNYQENGSAMLRERTTGPFHGGQFGRPGKEIELNRLEIIGEKGIGNLTATDPKYMLSISTDGGRSFGTEMWASAGPSGQFQHKVQWHGLGRAEEFVFKITTSDAAPFTIYSAMADITLGI